MALAGAVLLRVALAHQRAASRIAYLARQRAVGAVKRKHQRVLRIAAIALSALEQTRRKRRRNGGALRLISAQLNSSIGVTNK